MIKEWGLWDLPVWQLFMVLLLQILIGYCFQKAAVSYRYKALKTEKFNVGLDAAVGKGDWGIYFHIGEAF
ncbi:hypothetical protein [Flavobacterium pectinovorum]|uniref:hypothetical protein n=1 Tax=Flavobacterium pectinovorum TaxID=29533 RepID=UPI001FAC1977|nr:hypothetical protein [Flavobacterium pectinovorum]MCI9846044.1 hypothetical protein [Flavobacterium pectinovorum]